MWQIKQSAFLPLLLSVQISAANTDNIKAQDKGLILSQLAFSANSTIKTTLGESILSIKKEKMKIKELRKWFNDQVFLIESANKPFVPPYAGALSKDHVCKGNLRPRELETKNSNVIGAFQYHSTSRFVQADCSQHDIKFLSILLVVYCEKANTGYKMKVHIPKEKIQKKSAKSYIDEIKC